LGGLLTGGGLVLVDVSLGTLVAVAGGSSPPNRFSKNSRSPEAVGLGVTASVGAAVPVGVGVLGWSGHNPGPNIPWLKASRLAASVTPICCRKLVSIASSGVPASQVSLSWTVSTMLAMSAPL
jgi:hypothetical protein